MQNFAHNCLIVALACTALLSGCATTVRPESLKKPETLTCLPVPGGVEAHEVRGLLDYHWTTRVTPGPYIAELEDAEGTYYRAPLGGVYVGCDETADKPPTPLLPRTFDGGIWIPRVPGKSPHIYTYISTQEATIVPPPPNASCATAVAVPDPQSKGVSVVAFATGGAAGGAVGGALAKTTSRTGTMSYGQAAGAGAVGGAIGGLIVAGLINMDVGKIVHHPQSQDAKFRAALESLATQIVKVSALPSEAAATGQ